MAQIPQKVEARLTAGLKRFQPILRDAKTRDIGESDTVTIISDILSYVFGYEKYSEITSEHAVKSTYCDLAIKLDGALKILIEAKAIGLELKDTHVKQAIDYAANQGVDWVALTNGIIWRIYRVHFTKPIDQELVAEFDLTAMSPKSADDLWLMFLCCKEGWAKSALGDYHEQRQALSRFFVASFVLSEPVVSVIRRQIRKMCPDVKITVEAITAVLENEVLKRDVVEGEKATDARKKVARFLAKEERAKEKADDAEPSPASSSGP